MRAGIYITEAQNFSIDLMKLALQRVGSDSICILDGDSETQVDDKLFENEHNGLRRAVEVFKGSNIFGTVTLQKNYRSEISNLAELM